MLGTVWLYCGAAGAAAIGCALTGGTCASGCGVTSWIGWAAVGCGEVPLGTGVPVGGGAALPEAIF